MESLFEGEDWKYLKESEHSSIAVMGGIPYAFDSYDIDLMDDPNAQALREIVNSHLVLEFEIGFKIRPLMFFPIRLSKLKTQKENIIWNLAYSKISYLSFIFYHQESTFNNKLKILSEKVY